MKALIFNAGRGSRLGALTKECPKGLVALANGETLFARQVRLLAAAGIRDFVVVLGYLGEAFRKAAQPFEAKGVHFLFVENPDWAQSNAIVSMQCAAPFLRDDSWLVLHGDLAFDESWVADVMAAEAESLAAVSGKPPLNDKDFKARLQNGQVSAIAVDIFDEGCVNLMPFYKVAAPAMSLWLEAVDAALERGETQIYAETAAAPILPLMQLAPFSYEAHVLLEVDTPEDLACANAQLFTR